MDAVRNFGNFAAHPMTSTQTGDATVVEPYEAERVLTVIKALFNYYFVQPEVFKSKKDQINVKLRAVGKKRPP